MQSRALGKCLIPGYQLVPCLASKARQSCGEPGKDSNYYCHLALCSIYGFRSLPSCCGFRSQGSRPLHLLSFAYTRVTWLIFRGGGDSASGKLLITCNLSVHVCDQESCLCMCVCVCMSVACMHVCTYTPVCSCMWRSEDNLECLSLFV